MPRGGSGRTCPKGGATPQVDGDVDQLQRLLLPQEHGKGQAAPAARLPIRRQHQKAADTNVDAPAMAHSLGWARY
jgi:hypothetical protein